MYNSTPNSPEKLVKSAASMWPVAIEDEWLPIHSAYADYEKRGVSGEIAEYLGMLPLDREMASQALGFAVSSHGYLITYPGTDTIRVRMAKGDRRYLSPKGSGCTPPYMPDLPDKFYLDWDAIKKDTTKAVCITEGEWKSIYGCMNGLPTIGIGGVDMQDTLFDGSIKWKDRPTFVVFDHDEGFEAEAYKPSVFNALGRLCAKLIAAGAVVRVLHIGTACKDLSVKWGLDDFLKEGGSWGDLLKTVTAPPAWCSELADMLESCVYVVGTNHVHIYNINNGSRKSPSDFHETHTEKKRVETDADGKVKVRQLSRIWVEHPARLTVEDYDLNPCLPFGVQRDRINLWRGFPAFEAGSLAKTMAIQQEWQKFMEGVFGTEEVVCSNRDGHDWAMPSWKWVGLWTGHMLNRPEEPTDQAILVTTMVQGLGKSLYADVVQDLCGAHGGECSPDRLFDRFNSKVEGKAFIQTNELDVKFSSKESQMNDLLTSQSIDVECKGKDVIILPNLARRYWTSNSASPCRLSKGQRRVYVVNPPITEQQAAGEWGVFVRTIVAQFRKDPEALAAIRMWFDNLWGTFGSDWDSRARVPQTLAGEEVAEASMTKKQIIATAMWEHICASDGEWAAVHPDLKRRDTAMWGEVLKMVQAHGCKSAEKLVKEQGVPKTYTVFVSDPSKVDLLRKPGGKGWAARLEADAVRGSALATAAELAKILEQMGLSHADTR